MHGASQVGGGRSEGGECECAHKRLAWHACELVETQGSDLKISEDVSCTSAMNTGIMLVHVSQ